jgi:hypothetical protein
MALGFTLIFGIMKVVNFAHGTLHAWGRCGVGPFPEDRLSCSRSSCLLSAQRNKRYPGRYRHMERLGAVIA